MWPQLTRSVVFGCPKEKRRGRAQPVSCHRQLRLVTALQAYCYLLTEAFPQEKRVAKGGRQLVADAEAATAACFEAYFARYGFVSPEVVEQLKQVRRHAVKWVTQWCRLLMLRSTGVVEQLKQVSDPKRRCLLEMLPLCPRYSFAPFPIRAWRRRPLTTRGKRFFTVFIFRFKCNVAFACRASGCSTRAWSSWLQPRRRLAAAMAHRRPASGSPRSSSSTASR